ncbi:MAG: M1 family metallopeptidase [Chitinophagaceae bacterium]|nr:M1 family metallopeptidase [Chitinophagaceae bacterium]
MKVFISLIAGIVCLKSDVVAQKKGSAIDVQRYIFNVHINDKNDSVSCTATIQFKWLQNTENILLDLISLRPDGKGMKIISVTDKGMPLNYEHAKDIIRIGFSTPGKTNDEKTIEIKYRGIPADGLIIAKNKYNHRTFFADHWPDRARNWLACVDHPSDKAAVEFMVTAPGHYQVISNGVLIEETNISDNRKFFHYQEDRALPMKVAAIGVADFAVRNEEPVGNIPVSSWVFPEDRVKGFYDYKLAIDILPYFIKNIGPYPYKKLANVQSRTVFGGMENAGAIFYAEKSITGKRSEEVLIAHEIAHQWFGNMATEADFAHVWLSEGFVTYMAILWIENKYGQDRAMKMRVEDREQALAFSKQRSASMVDSSTTNYLELLNPNSYQKGGWILHMLHHQLGDSIFWKGIRSYYAQYAGKNAVTEDFRKVMEKVSGKDLEKFFQQWLYTPDHPQMDIRWKYDAMTKLLTVTIIQQQPKEFEFPLEMNITAADSKLVTKSVLIKDKQTTITMSLPGKPLKIVIDPAVHLFYEGGVKEIR